MFATFNQLRLGFNHEGMIAPYLVGFSTIGSAHDKTGTTILHQATPETAKGLSGVTMVPHQMHTTRPEARTCVECHRSPVTFGLGSTNFRLTREYGYAVSERGFLTIAVDAKNPSNTRAVSDLDIPGSPRALAVRLDPVHARATHAYVGSEDGTLTIISLGSPVLPQIVARKKLLGDPRDLVAQGDYLFVADGVAGLRIFDIEAPTKPKLLASMPTTDARDLAVQFPWLCIADGAGGLLTVDISNPRRPEFLAEVDLNGENARPNEAFDVKLLFQYSRLQDRATARKQSQQGRTGQRQPKRREPRRRNAPGIVRGRARHLAFVACGLDGVRIVDITEPQKPVLLGDKALSFDRGDVTGVAINTVFDLGSAGGGLKSGERDYLYVHTWRGGPEARRTFVYAFDVTDPTKPRRVPDEVRVDPGTGKLELVRAYNAPFLQHFVTASGAGGIGTLIDVSKNQTGPTLAARWAGSERIRDLEFEEFAFDRLQDERGRAIKDISHEGCRYLTPDEMLRVLRADIPVGIDDVDRYGRVRRRRNR